MAHSFLSNMDWEMAKRQRLQPPLIPPQGEVNAADAFEIGAFDEEDTQGIRVSFKIPHYYRLSVIIGNDCRYICRHKQIPSITHFIRGIITRKQTGSRANSLDDFTETQLLGFEYFSVQ